MAKSPEQDPENEFDPEEEDQDEDQDLETEDDELEDDELSEELVQEIALADEIQRMERAQQQRNADRVPIPQLSSDTSSDPVRLYLKEIGQVDLLDVDHEFWLATWLEAPKYLSLIHI